MYYTLVTCNFCCSKDLSVQKLHIECSSCGARGPKGCDSRDGQRLWNKSIMVNEEKRFYFEMQVPETEMGKT
jgi:hypothetical protein